MCGAENEPINPSDSNSFAKLKECLVDIKRLMNPNFFYSVHKNPPGLCCLAPWKNLKKETIS